MNTLLVHVMGLTYELTTNEQVYNSSDQPKINYSNKNLSDGVHIVPHVILFEYGIKDYFIEVNQHEHYLKYFFKNGKGDVPFDLFAAAFWLLSRYEEYLPFKANKYNVFDHRSSLAWQNDFLSKPLVNIWLNEFKKHLILKFPQLEFKSHKPVITTTIDIDSAYKYKYKGFVRTLAGFYNDLKRFDIKQLKERFRTVFLNETDEFDCYKFLVETHKKYNSKVIYFFLLGDYGINDKNHPSSNLNFQSLIKHLSDYSSTGIHPSFASNFNMQQLKVEIVRLATITHKEVLHSRQHFGMLSFPKTYSALIQSGIKNDYSLGYANMNGYRASICFPFKWYNISEEQETALTLHPFCLTDVALEKEWGNDSANAIKKIDQTLKEVKSYSGEFITVFHSDKLANTGNGLIWRKVYNALQEQTVMFDQ